MDRLTAGRSNSARQSSAPRSGRSASSRPGLIGGGDDITQRTPRRRCDARHAPVGFLLRFGLGAVSYAAPVPGGLFAPMLVLGAQLGLFFGALCQLAFPAAAIDPIAFAVVGMAAFFTGVVQAPVTGIVLVIEMTAGFTMLLPMIAACFAAMLVPNLLRSVPIYESLRRAGVPDAAERSSFRPTRTADARAENSR